MAKNQVLQQIEQLDEKLNQILELLTTQAQAPAPTSALPANPVTKTKAEIDEFFARKKAAKAAKAAALAGQPIPAVPTAEKPAIKWTDIPPTPEQLARRLAMAEAKLAAMESGTTTKV